MPLYRVELSKMLDFRRHVVVEARNAAEAEDAAWGKASDDWTDDNSKCVGTGSDEVIEVQEIPD